MSDVPLLTPIRNSGTETGILFVHGFGGNPAETWGNFPTLIVADSRLADWDLFSVGYTTRLVPDLVGIWKANAPIDRLADFAVYGGLRNRRWSRISRLSLSVTAWVDW